MTDEELVILCQKGDRAGLEIYERYKRRVREITRQFFLSGGETEDLVQEGMMGLFSAVNGYIPSEGSFSAYASRCIKNKIVDAVKKSNGAKHSALNGFLQIVEIGEEWVTLLSPEDEVIMREDKNELLRKMKENLTSIEFETLLMYTEGMTIAEISSKLNVNHKSVDNAVSRAKHKLLKLLSAEK